LRYFIENLDFRKMFAYRDAVEFILRAQKLWDRVVENYVFERSPKSAAVRQ
jgi:hypothetical protein